jgi:hypothetical protein
LAQRIREWRSHGNEQRRATPANESDGGRNQFLRRGRALAQAIETIGFDGERLGEISLPLGRLLTVAYAILAREAKGAV